jgi:hypothetical protein
MPAAPAPDLEVQMLSRTRRLIALQRWLFGLAIGFTAIGLALRVTFHDGRISSVNLVVLEHQAEVGVFLVIGAALWVVYFTLKRRLRT